jgi:hypothetical protein
MTADVDVALEKDLAELVNGSTWHTADRLVEAFPVAEYGESVHGAHTNLYAELDVLSDALRRDYGIELKVPTLAQYRATAVAWPDHTRVQSAPYRVHEMMRVRADRVKRLERLVRKHGGRLTERQYRTWKAEQNPKPVEPWLAAIERRLRTVVRAADSPAARTEVAAVLERLARELRA